MHFDSFWGLYDVTWLWLNGLCQYILSLQLCYVYIYIWVCLKMLCTPLYPMVLLIIIPMKNDVFSLGILTQHFQTNPYSTKHPIIPPSWESGSRCRSCCTISVELPDPLKNLYPTNLYSGSVAAKSSAIFYQ